MMSSKLSGARALRGRRARLLSARSIEYEIGGALCLCSCMNQKLAIVAKLLQPAGHVRGLILDDRVRDSSFRAEIGGSHFRHLS
jgi:hypothetical protein